MAASTFAFATVPVTTRPSCRSAQPVVMRAQAAHSERSGRSVAAGLLSSALIGAAASLSLVASPALADVSEATVRQTQEIGKPSPPPKQSSSKAEEPEKVSPVRSALNNILGREGPIGTPAAPNTTAGGGSTGLAERR